VQTAHAGVSESRNPRASSLYQLVEDYYEETDPDFLAWEAAGRLFDGID